MYRAITLDTNGEVYESSELLSLEDGLDHLKVTRLLHVVGGWSVERCCEVGLIFRKGELLRGVHLESMNDELESLALAVGVLAPASLNGRLEVVV